MKNKLMIVLGLLTLVLLVVTLTGCESSGYGGVSHVSVHHGYGYGPGWGYGWRGGYYPGGGVIVGPPVAVPY